MKYAAFSIFYRIFKRTEGISTTDIVGRMLLMTKETMWEEKVMIILSLESLLEVNCS
jgi:hypothetical protein